MATPPAPTDLRGFERGDKVTLQRENKEWKRVTTYEFDGREDWYLISNLLTNKMAPAHLMEPKSVPR